MPITQTKLCKEYNKIGGNWGRVPVVPFGTIGTRPELYLKGQLGTDHQLIINNCLFLSDKYNRRESIK